MESFIAFTASRLPPVYPSGANISAKSLELAMEREAQSVFAGRALAFA